MKNISFIITLFFIVSLSSLEKISAQPYTIKRLGMEDGLSSNYTQKIIQDQKGYIWVATSSGLNRFDGQKFILYGQDNHKTEQNWINSLLADPTNDNVWVGTDQGLFYFAYPYVAERILYDALCIGTRQTVSVIAGCDTGKDGLCWRGERILE